MAKKMTATQAKAKLLAALDDVADGEEIEITRHGRLVARLVPATGPKAIKGSMAGVALSIADEEQLFSTGEPWELRD
jgi:prevent-host-death family protein